MPQPQPPGMPTLNVRQPWWQRLSHWLGNEGGSDDDVYAQYHDRSARVELSPYSTSYAGGFGGAAGMLPKLASVVPPGSAASRFSEVEQSAGKAALPVERQSARRNPRRGPVQKASRPEGKVAPPGHSARVHGAKTEHFPPAPLRPPHSARSNDRSAYSHGRPGKESDLIQPSSQQHPAACTRGSAQQPPISPPQLPEVKPVSLDMDPFQDGVWDLATIIPMPQDMRKGKHKGSARASKREQAFWMEARQIQNDNSTDAAAHRSSSGRRSKRIAQGLPDLIDRESGKTCEALATPAEAPVTPSTAATTRTTSAPGTESTAQKMSAGSSARQSMASSETSPGHSSARHSLPIADKSPGSGVRRSLGDFSGSPRRSMPSGDETSPRRSMPSGDGTPGTRRSMNDLPATRRSMLSVNQPPDEHPASEDDSWIAAAAARHSLRGGDVHVAGQRPQVPPVSAAAEQAANKLADKYKDPQGRLKAGHEAWRRQHDALQKRRSAGYWRKDIRPRAIGSSAQKVFGKRMQKDCRAGLSEACCTHQSGGVVVSDSDEDVTFRPGRRTSDTEDKKEASSSIPEETKPADAGDADNPIQQDSSRSSSKQSAGKPDTSKNTEAYISGGSSSSTRRSIDNANSQRIGLNSSSSRQSLDHSSSLRGDGQKSSASHQRGGAAVEHHGAGAASAVDGSGDAATNASESLGAAGAVNSAALARPDTGDQKSAPPSRDRSARNPRKRHTCDSEVFRSFHSESSAHSAGNDHEDGHRPRPSTPGPATPGSPPAAANPKMLRRQKTMAASVGRSHSKTTSSRPGTMEDSVPDEQAGPVTDAQSTESRPSVCLRWQSQVYTNLPKSAEGKDHEADACFAIAKKHNIAANEVWNRYETFKSFDQGHDPDGLSQKEFEKLVRHYCNLPEDGPIPDHLLNRHDHHHDIDHDGKVSFEEFVVWSIEVDFAEEVMVPDPKERHLRQLAREHDFLLTDVERIKGIFDSFDIDKSGEIDEEEFRKALFVLLRAKNESDVSQKKLLRYWREADVDRSGEISFEEFLLWYYRCFVSENGHFY